jgi:hypothetical protein
VVNRELLENAVFQDPASRGAAGDDLAQGGFGFKLLPSPTGFASLPSADELQG